MTQAILARVSDDISKPIRLWHVSPIRLRHVSLTHPQTPINRSLPKTFKVFKERPRTSRAQATSEKIQKHSEVQKLYENQASKPSRTSTSKSKNTRSVNIQTICLDPKVYGNQTQKSKNPQQTTNWWSSTDSNLQSPEELPPQTFKYEEHSKQNHLNYLPRSQSSLESSSKASRNLTNHKSMKLYGFEPLKHRRTSTTNLQRRRTHQEHEEHVKNTKNTKNKKFLTSL